MLMQLAEMTEVDDNKTTQVGSSFVQMVRVNYEGYTKREVLGAKEVHRGQALLGNPSEKDYQRMVSSNMIKTAQFQHRTYLTLVPSSDRTSQV